MDPIRFTATLHASRTDLDGETKVTLTVSQNQQREIAALPLLAKQVLQVQITVLQNAIIGGRRIHHEEREP